MAAIISQMAANKRARQKQGRRVIPPDKCVYVIPPFDPCFDPKIHNKYVKALSLKAEMEDKAEAEKQEAILKKKAEAAEDMRCTIMRLVVVSLGIFSIVFLAFYLYIMTNHQWQTKTKIV